MIKKINSANAGVKRPIRVSDLQDIWDGINDVSGKLSVTNPIIISGFNDKGNGYLSAGVIAKAGILYYHPDTSTSRIAIGATAYGHQVASVDQRVFEDSTTQDFAYQMIAKTASSGVSFGVLSLQRVAQLRLKDGKKEVTGVLSFSIFEATTPTLTFVADSAIGAGIVVTSDVTTNYVKLAIVDADAVRMSRNFSIMPANTSDMDSLFTSYPDIIMCASPTEPKDIIFKWVGGVPNPPATYSYRLKILFDV